ncbi:endolytic transglycosylase MltG [Paracoccaceae bacterium GXU_MW_L88]
MARHFVANVLTVLIVLFAVAVGVVYWGKAQFEEGGTTEDMVIFEVPRGGSMGGVSQALAEEGIISNASLFRIGARYLGKEGDLKFGEYEIPAGASMAQVLDIVTSGRTISWNVTVPEGLTSWQVVQLLNSVEFLTGEITEIPPEGSLAPNTYGVSRNASRESVIALMSEAQEQILAEEWENRAEDAAVETPEEALILASIIEKETGVASERELVSAVFTNRLEQGMRLQTDPTVIYGITMGEGTLGRGIRRSELDAETPYNTYVISGLPPTPIANPGRLAIAAALNPAESDYVYFVADGTGGHAFATTLAEHEANVVKWRQIEAERAAAAEAEAADSGSEEVGPEGGDSTAGGN